MHPTTAELIRTYTQGIRERAQTEGRYCRDNRFMRQTPIPPAFDSYAVRAVLGHGATSMAILLADGTVLKLGQHLNRALQPFDLPAFGQGSHDGIPYVIQPRADPCTWDDLEIFQARLGKNWRFHDNYPDNLGRYDGRVLLFDYDAVVARELPHSHE